MINKTKLDELKMKHVDENDEFSEMFYYEELLKCISADIIDHEDEDAWQGDSWYLFKQDDYGYLVFGWGSCSGCDALQGCENFDEVTDLLNRLHDSIIWKSREEMLEYFETKDWKLEYYGKNPEFKKFKARVIKHLKRED